MTPATFYNYGWRPFIGWSCSIALTYAMLVEPVLRFICVVVFRYQGMFPGIDNDLTFQVVLAMLGIAGLRSYDKKQGVAK